MGMEEGKIIKYSGQKQSVNKICRGMKKKVCTFAEAIEDNV